VATPDVQPLVQLGAERCGVVEATEEQRYGRVVLQGPHAAIEGLLQILRGDRVAAYGVFDAGGCFAHAVQRGAGLGEVAAFGGEDGIVRGHGPLQVKAVSGVAEGGSRGRVFEWADARR